MRRRRPDRNARRPLALAFGVVATLAVLGIGSAWFAPEQPDASWRFADIAVDGLDCAFWCPVKIATALECRPGARVDSVDTRAGSVHVRFDPRRRALDELVATIRLQGFVVTAATLRD